MVVILLSEGLFDILFRIEAQNLGRVIVEIYTGEKISFY